MLQVLKGRPEETSRSKINRDEGCGQDPAGSFGCSTANLQTTNYLSPRQLRDAIRGRGEAAADFSRALDLTGSFPPPPQVSEALEGEEGHTAGPDGPQANSATLNAAPELPGVAFGYVVSEVVR